MLVGMKRFFLTIGILCVTAALVTDVKATRQAVTIREALATAPSSRTTVSILGVLGWAMIIGSVTSMLVEAFHRSRAPARRVTEVDSDVASDSSD